MADATHRRRQLPILGERMGRWVGAVGVLACTACCISIPGIGAALAATGLGFLRNDRILLPGAVLFAALAAWAFHRSYRAHRRFTPGGVGVAAAVAVLAGLRMPGATGRALIWAGIPLMFAATIWDWRLQRRCRI